MENMNELYSDIILEHNQCQENKHPPGRCQPQRTRPQPRAAVTTSNSLQADIQDGVIKDAAYTGHGCAISQASADIMIDLIKGKTVKEALRLVDLFPDMNGKSPTMTSWKNWKTPSP